MQCGTEIEEVISQQKADSLSQEFNLNVKKGFASEQEKIIGGKPDSYLREGNYKNLIVQVRRKQAEHILTIRGSLHKFYHGNNAGDFWGYEIMNALTRLINVFDLTPTHARIKNIEIGVNIPVWFPVYSYLKSNLIQHRKKPFLEPREMIRKGFTCHHEDYLIKMYAKEKNLLRYEIKFSSIKKVRETFGVTSLADLKEETINLMVDFLKAEWEEIIMRDGVNIYDKTGRMDLLSESEREKLLQFSSSIYLSSYEEKLREAVTENQKDSLRQKSYRLKKDCLKLINKYGNGHHNTLSEFITELTDMFKNSWNLSSTINVTKSAFNKTGENVTLDINIISSINR